MREEGILLETIRSSPVNSRSCHRRAYAHTPRGTTFELAGGRPIYGRSRQALGVGHCATEHPEILVYQFVLRGPRLPSVFGKARESRGEREREEVETAQAYTYPPVLLPRLPHLLHPPQISLRSANVAACILNHHPPQSALHPYPTLASISFHHPSPHLYWDDVGHSFIYLDRIDHESPYRSSRVSSLLRLPRADPVPPWATISSNTNLSLFPPTRKPPHRHPLRDPIWAMAPTSNGKDCSVGSPPTITPRR